MHIESPKEKALIRADRLADEIRARYVEATQLKRDCVTAGRAAVVAAYECGQLLNRTKGLIGHGKFLAWLLQTLPEISERTAQNWMKLAKTQTLADLEDCKKLKDAYVKCEIMPESIKVDKGVGTAEVHVLDMFVERVCKLADLVEGWDLSGLPPEQKQDVITKLKGIEGRL